MKLNELRSPKGARKRKKIVGRGPGSGHGKTACKGHKGQLARSGGSTTPGFEGGQMPLQRIIPKRGFTNPFKTVYQVVNLGLIDKHFNTGDVVTPESLKEKGIIKRRSGVKILCDGELQKSLVIKANKFSKSAEEKIKQAGGSLEVI
ncbi:MAG: 50S ribosomal protein L15 [Nitrospirae bacterium]|nr:50S ribosomal protein L15 [Nitrospirota bacterium]